MDSKTAIIEAVGAGRDLPTELRQHVAEVTAVEVHRFDASYLEFLDTQIRLSPRGPGWTERLRQRRAALLPFCDAVLVRGCIRVTDSDFFAVEVDPKTRAVIHWERYGEEGA